MSTSEPGSCLPTDHTNSATLLLILDFVLWLWCAPLTSVNLEIEPNPAIPRGAAGPSCLQKKRGERGSLAAYHDAGT
jgi:hypothetical protein